MRTILLGALLAAAALAACDEHKYDAILAESGASATAVALPTTTATPSATASAAATWKKRSASDCKPNPATIDFGGDAALEAEVRKKLGKDAGAITPADLALIKSINLSTAKVHQIDPCVFPLLTSLKDLFLGPGEYDDLIPIQKLATLESLRLSYSHVKDLHAIEGLKRMDRLDISHTLVGDDELKSVGSLTNVTELMLDEDSPIAARRRRRRKLASPLPLLRIPLRAGGNAGGRGGCGGGRPVGFSDDERAENIRRVAEVAKLMVDGGLIVLVAVISPFRSQRRTARSLFEAHKFIEVYVNAPLAVAAERDPKGLYAKARRGELKSFPRYRLPVRASRPAGVWRSIRRAARRPTLRDSGHRGNRRRGDGCAGPGRGGASGLCACEVPVAGDRVIVSALLVAQIVPSIVLATSLFVIFHWIHLVNTYLGLLPPMALTPFPFPSSCCGPSSSACRTT